ncbi:Tc toxin subunit A, partial [Chamaesiphon sp. VAR_48_metabat_403]|uniref:Tc toxin subunit A n=1 Tax=Chamaesiphon sp. VAR_48_metabat_403 TaxID=2964700 RepID=UPI00286D7DC3
MTPQALKFADKIKFFNSVLSTKTHQDAVDAAIKEADGDMANALKSLKTKLPAASLRKVDLAYQLEDWAGQNIPVVQALVKNAEIDSLRDIALNYNVKKLADIVDSKHLPEDTAGKTASEKKKNFAVALHHKLFTTETSAVLQRMVQDAEIPILDQTVGAGVAKFFENQPDFNIRTTSIYTALKHTKAFAGIAEEHQAAVVEELKKLQRVQSLSPASESIPVLIQANLTSAFGVAEMPESSFIRAHGKALGQETARQVYTNAINNRIRNEQALMTMRESVRGTGLAIIDGDRSMEDRRAMMLQAFADKTEVPDNVNWEKLFGDMDVCECEECTSVYSPASYFVELLQYLRNNTLGPDPASGDPDPKNNKNIKPGIKGTPLEKMFRRRPDLGCLELTCDNTFTVLPYIDLVNEVMESFVVHLEEYEKSPEEPKQARLDTFNVEDETTSELLAQPQHTNYQAYCILKSAVYPFTLPYHQPIDATRIFLKYLGTSRYELLNTYRAVDEACANNSFTSEGQNELKKLHQQTLDRAVDAEFLGMTQEEYIILTKEAFWPKGYFDIALGKNHTEEEYQEKIGVKPVHEYYGYETKDAMLDIDETNQLGLTFVKKRFLPLTGIQYIDLVEILKTQFINPNHPQGDDLKILESIRFSYRFLQTLVDTNSNNPSIRFAKLVAFLETAQFFVPLLDAYLHPDPCQKQKPGWHLEIRDLRKWVYCYFERIGELIVLEAGEGPYLPIEGSVYTKLLQEASEPKFVGTLRKDGLIVDENEEFIGSVTITSQVIRADGQLFISQFGEGTQLEVRDSNSAPIGYINQSSILVSKDSETTVNWSPAQDTCDLDKVRLVHLDGTALSDHEYDRFQRFIRLWRKLGWTINEVDKALVGLSAQKDPREGATASDDCEYVGFEIFDDNCTSSSGGFINGCNNNDSEDSCDDVEQWTNCVERNDSISEITPDFLNQIVAVRKLLDLSGLSLIQLLAFWSDISTVGEKSLYARLFLTHNLLGIDKVFKADQSGAYLTKSAKISDHLPVLMAALRLKSDDIMNMMDKKFFAEPLTDLLNLKNVSIIYRYSVLAKILHLRIEELDGAIELFGKPRQFKIEVQRLEVFPGGTH